MTRLIVILAALLPAQIVSGQVVLRPVSEAPGQYIVQFAEIRESKLRRSGDRRAAMQELRSRLLWHRLALLRDLADSDLEVLRDLWIRQAVAVSVSEVYLERIAELPYVHAVRPDRRYEVEPQSIVTLPLSGEIVQDNIERIDVDSLWNDHYRGQGVVVAVLDSGVDPIHDDLADRYRGGNNSWFDPYDQQPVPRDLTGHGTAVASVVLGGDASGSFLGVAPYAQWIGARIFDDFGISTESAISAVLQWIVDPDGNPATDDFPDVVQNSWGLDASEGSCVNPFATEIDAIDAFGIDQVFAVGNSGLSGPGPGGFSSFLTPAFDAHAISVGATRDDDTLLFNSSRGPDICGSSIIPSLVAPGDLVKTAELTFDGFDSDNTAINSGTSYSSPHVAGALALLRSKYAAPDHLDYRQALFDTAIPLGAQDDYGRGLIQATAAATRMENQSIPLRDNEVSFSAASYSFLENDAAARVQVIRSGDLDGSASVDIESSDGSALAVADYQAVMATIDFNAGEAVKTVDIVLTDDTTGEESEDFVLTLSQNVNVNLGARTVVSILVRDEDNPEDEEDEIGGSGMGPGNLVILLLLWIVKRGRE